MMDKADSAAPATGRYAIRTVQMNRTLTIDGTEINFRRSIAGWVAEVGCRVVHFRQPGEDGVWIANSPFALEPLATGRTIEDVVRKVQELSK